MQPNATTGQSGIAKAETLPETVKIGTLADAAKQLLHLRVAVVKILVRVAARATDKKKLLRHVTIAEASLSAVRS